MADTANSLSLHASFYFLEELLTQAPECAVGVIGSGQGLGSSLENRIATGLAELVKEHDLPALYKAVVKAEAAIGARVTRQTGVPSEELKELIDHARLRDLSQLFDDLFGDVLDAPRA